MQNNRLEIEELYKEKRKLWEKEYEIDKKLKVLTKDIPSEEGVYKFIGISIDVLNLDKENNFCGWEMDKYFMSGGILPHRKLDLKVINEAIDCLQVMRAFYEKNEGKSEFREILDRELGDFGTNRLEWYLMSLERENNQ